jgi:hypothetical protein
MITWLDRLARRVCERMDPKKHGGDPRKALAHLVFHTTLHAQLGNDFINDPLETLFSRVLGPFVREFLPAGADLVLKVDGLPPPRPLGLLLTRATANLLSAVSSFDVPDELWRAELGPTRSVYVDIPHGAIVMNAGVNGKEELEIRAILAAPYLPEDHPGCTLYIAQTTDRGSERERGRIAGVLRPDGGISRADVQGAEGIAAIPRAKPRPFDPTTESSVGFCAGMFLRMVLAYYFFGPVEARKLIATTPTDKLRAGKPRKDESLFAVTRLNSTELTGRPKATISGSWSLTNHQEVTGHFKLQPHGPGGSLRKMIWVDAYDRGPENAPVKPKAYKI